MGAPRCQECNKLCGLETEEPEIEQSDIDVFGDEGTKEVSATITASIKISRLSACCSCETKEYTFEVEEQFTLEGHFGEGHEFELDEGDIGLVEEGGGRYQKSYIGFGWQPKITCSCKKEVKTLKELDITDKVAASEFEELY